MGISLLKKPNHLHHLFVSEEFQGNGISRILWQHVQQHVKCDSFTLRSSIYAVPVYKKFGFTESAAVQTKGGISFQPMELLLSCQ
ncbi:GNAT family N-acetyltransferase [Agaribacterium haliotis]|uniref:GNAT family N-acetyltransferase n=1 Tax=Agaribacterium haliotis TaxID=2013869 RepID=UPI0019567C72